MAKSSQIPKVNDGISGPLRLDPELTETVYRELKRLEEIYPLEVKGVQLANPTDKRWKSWRDYNGKEKEEV